MPSRSDLSSKACQSGRVSSRIRNDRSITFAQAMAAADTVMEENSKTKATQKKYKLYFDQAVKYAKEFAEDEAKKHAAWKKHQSEALHPEDESDYADLDLGDNKECQEPTTEIPPDFDAAFDGPPKPFTPVALAMFLSEKCVNQGCKVGVAYAIYSSMLAHYDNLDNNDKYRGDWACDEKAGTCSGNPARSGRVQRMLHSLKKKDAEDSGDRKHSRAMSREDMDKIYAYVERNCPSKSEAEQFIHHGEGRYSPLHPELLSKRAESLNNLAFISTSWCIWTRCHETTNLQYKHFDFNMEPKHCSNGQVHPRFSINLRHRKNWQNKMESGELGIEGHYYNIYSCPDEPAVDAYRHVREWVQFYSDVILRRPLNPNDYIFPTINFSKLTANPEKESDHTAVQKMITQLADAAGLPNSERSKYTTHCFRRGGAQYRFSDAPLGKRWTLARIRWWAGWAKGETGDTIVRYLLDELSTYEEDHRDALCPVDEAASNSHLGEDRALRPFTAEDGKKLYEHCDDVLETQFKNLTERLVNVVRSQQLVREPSFSMPPPPAQPHANSSSRVQTPRTHARCNAPYPLPPTSARLPLTPSLVHTNSDSNIPRYPVLLPTQQHYSSGYPTTPTLHWQPPIQPTENLPPAASSLPPPQERRTIPRISKQKPELQWKTVVDDWELPQPDRCPIPLREWDPAWYKDTNQAVMYHIRKTIAEEYILEYDRDDARFLKDYPSHVRGITPLFKAIRAQHQKEGKARSRAKWKDGSE